MVLYLFYNGFIMLLNYYYTITYHYYSSILFYKAWKAWTSATPSWISRWTSCAQLMDSKADHNLHTTLTTAYPQLHKMALTHPYHTTTTTSEPISFIYLYIFLRKLLTFKIPECRLVERQETASGRTLPIISDRESR